MFYCANQSEIDEAIRRLPPRFAVRESAKKRFITLEAQTLLSGREQSI